MRACALLRAACLRAACARVVGSCATAFTTNLPAPGVVDLLRLEYVSSAGLRVFLLTQKRVKAAGSALSLINAAAPVYDVFRYAGFDRIISISQATDAK